MTESTVLVANRGEIAVRIIRACHDTGHRCVAVYADQDADALFVRLADEAWALNGDTAATTYLNIEAILDIAHRCHADAVHPGYGFLSEDAAAARAVAAAGLTWIGPDAEVIDRLGDKASARDLARSLDVPLAPGTPGPVSGPQEIHDFADSVGFPVAIKAIHGGGGRGLKVATCHDEVDELWASAVHEASLAFGNGECLAERFLSHPRHIEVQILADQHGTVLALGTRDCTLQRRHQKLVEEAPAPFLTPEIAQTIKDSAVRLCAAVGYVGAATAEFLLDADGTLTFLEVNTRLQVEHAVTEATTGWDIVAWQLAIAEGAHLPEEAPQPIGHAIEFRINAEDPARGFVPTPGSITRFVSPGGPGIRVDSGVEDGARVSGAFDSMLAKLIVSGQDRNRALARARRALREFRIEGIATTLPFDRAILDREEFSAVDAEHPFAVHTRWIDEDFPGLPEEDPLDAGDDARTVTTWIEIDGERHRLRMPASAAVFAAQGGSEVSELDEPSPAASVDDTSEGALAPFPATVVRWLVEEGDLVETDQPIVVLEAMKMEAIVNAPRPGILHRHVVAGDSVTARQVLATLMADSSQASPNTPVATPSLEQ